MGSSGVGPGRWSLAAAAVGLAGVLAFSPVAATASSHIPHHHINLVGHYDIFTSRAPAGTLTLDSDDSFTRSNGDAGTWTVWKGNVVLDFHASTANQGCIYLGTAETTGISSRNDPGPTNCHEARATWYAAKTTGTATPRVRPVGAVTTNARSASSHLARARPSAPARPRLVGVYDESNNADEPPATLTIRADGLVDLIGPAELDIGYWVHHNGAVAFAVVDSSDGSLAGCIFVGLPTATGIDSAPRPGLLDCGGSMFAWHATRTSGSAHLAPV
jgi:hypothetical protein